MVSNQAGSKLSSTPETPSLLSSPSPRAVSTAISGRSWLIQTARWIRLKDMYQRVCFEDADDYISDVNVNVIATTRYILDHETQ